ncbi:Alpha/Beta hydrolase fold [Arabidopsis thaliana x Arabidopsis arenosa]|uniref:Alpha/Beta hydrolase fold n=1 Tax=Arabidopsis thaliana x Arabidopsis arenosa TaxID=1240361 RepID=A0A8T2AU91_9BRAS|nr:Alpha/Beta hydrolase fold [Arabidopsis thaliana x Arabidopsis arenosa]
MAIRSLLRCRKWSKSEWLVAAIGIVLIVFSFSFSVDSTSDSSVDRSDLVKLKLSSKAKERGAFCLDGSLPGYHFHKGSGSGSKSWLLFLEGGGWCDTIESCSSRAMTSLGSSSFFEHKVAFQGVLSSDPSQNPDFFNWNRVLIRYCDGASFAGHPEAEFKNETRLFFRGQLIWEAIRDELLSMGMSHVKHAILTGCSAGGLATLIHCDYFRDNLPRDAAVKCVSDGGYFLNVPDVLGNPTMGSFFHDVVTLQNVDKSLDQNCVAKMEPSKCMFPREFIKNIRTPVFLVNAAYDYWQIQNVLVPDSADIDEYWAMCRLNIQECDAAQMKVLHGFRSSLMDAIGEFHQNKDGGMFINSCNSHCQMRESSWHSPTSPRIENKTIAESVGDWYFNRKPVKLIDCPYPCNTSYSIPSVDRSDLVKLKLSSKAKDRGAFCLDGSLPGYHFHKGSGSGSKSWLLYLEGGGGCRTIESCSSRAMTRLGSSNFFEHEVAFQGVLSSDPSQNPDFFNWNRVMIRYCDGACFSGHPEAEFKAILTGCSAGGLATLIHCDYFRDHLPKDATVKCVSDGGYILNVPDVLGNPTMGSFFHDVVTLQSVDKSLDQNCVAKMEPSKNSGFSCQHSLRLLIQNGLVPDSPDLDERWAICRLNIQECDAAQMKILHGFRSSLIDAIGEFHENKEGGMFINSCNSHCQIRESWHSPTSTRIENKTIAESVGDWYFNRKPVKLIDCPYPCNTSC